jgi:hypothetical protein
MYVAAILPLCPKPVLLLPPPHPAAAVAAILPLCHKPALLTGLQLL